jgi:uncharacterized membrane protein
MWLRAAGLFLIVGIAVLSPEASAQTRPQTAPAAKKPSSASPAAPAVPAAPQSTHFPILLLASGSEPVWSVRIGQKGPERLDRAGYPPAILEPVDVNREGTADAWTYRAKDSATGAEASLHLTREACSDGASAEKYTFKAVFQHAQIGILNGCARIAAELFPKINNQTEDDDPDKKPAPLPADVIKFKSPLAVAFLSLGNKVMVSRGATKKIAAAAGSELALSHDGKKLLYTRDDSKNGGGRTIVLYEAETGRSKDLVHGDVRKAFWSPDDSRVAYLKGQDQLSQVWVFAAATPEQSAPFGADKVSTLHGWVDAHSVLASDAQTAYWMADDNRPAQSVSLQEIYGAGFEISGSDTLRLNPINLDLLLVSANFAKAPEGTPVDAKGIAAGFFLYELHSKRRTVLSPPDQWGRYGEWSRDGVQIFYTRRVTAASSGTYRILWDGSSGRRYVEGTDLVVGQ